MHSSTSPLTIKVGARSSPLSKKQVVEVLSEIQNHYPHITFDCVFTETLGDKDKKTSLRSLDKTDFFTREVDEFVLSGRCRIGIHSAKDLPDPLRKGLQVIAITKGVDSSDVVVMREGESISSLLPNAIIATSSERREEAVRQLRTDLKFVDVRGTIQERLDKLNNGEADGVVIAEAALIRLGLTHLNRQKLPGDTVPYQGQLAIVGKDDDDEMKRIFSILHKELKQ